MWPILWEGNEQRQLGSEGKGIIAVALADDGPRVLGFRNYAQGPLALMWIEARGWDKLGTDYGWIPTSMNNSGAIVGYLQRDGYRRPWILTPGEPVELLPHYAYHNTQADHIDGSGLIAGQARADHGSHPLMWQQRGVGLCTQFA